MCVGDSLWHSEETVEVSNCAFQCDCFIIIIIIIIVLLLLLLLQLLLLLLLAGALM